MARPDLDMILDRCIDRLRGGEPLASCLAEYPDTADELDPLLTLSLSLERVAPLEPLPEVSAAHFERVAAALDERDARRQAGAGGGLFNGIGLMGAFRTLQRRPIRLLGRAVVFLFVALAITGGFVFSAAADSLPGDLLYPVKRAGENLRVSIAREEHDRAALEDSFNRERLEEIEALRLLGRRAAVEFEGVVEARSEKGVVIEGLFLQVNPETVIVGRLETGRPVRVRAEVDDTGEITATRIDNRGQEPVGLPTLEPTATATRDLPAVRTRDTQSPLPADRTPTPDREKLPTPIIERESTATPVPGRTRDGQVVDEPTPSRSPTEIPSPTPSDRPHQETKPAPTATPEKEREPTATPPAPTREATRKPAPTATPHRDHIDEPTATPPRDRITEPTATPHGDQGSKPAPTDSHPREPTATPGGDDGRDRNHATRPP